MNQMRDIAPYACRDAKLKGRIFPENEKDAECVFLEDKERIICSVAFRRLQYKTQVFMNSAGDHYRTRLTHSLEVAAVAKNISRTLALDEDLCEVIALAHDLGHPPFGHAGEDGLSRAMQQYGGFDHNFQTLKVIALLENRYFNFSGLNLTLAVIEGLVKHNGPLQIDNAFKRNVQNLFGNVDLKLEKQTSLEAQVASLADDIAYCTHDVDDGIRSGFLSMSDLLAVEVFKKAYDSIRNEYPKSSGDILNSSVIRRVRQLMIEDLIVTTRQALQQHKIESCEDVCNARESMVTHSQIIRDVIIQLKAILMKKVYRHEAIDEMRQTSDTIVTSLFNFFMNDPKQLPQQWSNKLKDMSDGAIAVIICDYIAGMTDRFAIKEYERLL